MSLSVYAALIASAVKQGMVMNVPLPEELSPYFHHLMTISRLLYTLHRVVCQLYTNTRHMLYTLHRVVCQLYMNTRHMLYTLHRVVFQLYMNTRHVLVIYNVHLILK